MGERDPRIDAYIAKSAPFAKPILKHIRGVIHSACPDVEETIKWGSPAFDYQGPMCGMAAFKQHCALSLWKSSLVLDKKGNRADEAMGHFGRLTSIADLPSKRTLTGYIKTAMKLNEAGVKVQRPKPAAPKKLVVSADLKAALAKSKKALAGFEAFSPSQKREYVEWLTEAKGEGTRKRRLATAVEWIKEGKSRNWKYERK